MADGVLQELLNAIANMAWLGGALGTSDEAAVGKVPGFIFAIRLLLSVLLEIFSSLENATSMLPCAFTP